MYFECVWLLYRRFFDCFSVICNKTFYKVYTLFSHTHLTTLSQFLAVGGVTHLVLYYRPNLCCDCCPWQTFALSALTHPPSGDLPLSVSDSSYGSSTIIHAQSKTTNEALLRNISVHFMFHGWQPLRRVAEFRRTSHLQFTSYLRRESNPGTGCVEQLGDGD